MRSSAIRLSTQGLFIVRNSCKKSSNATQLVRCITTKSVQVNNTNKVEPNLKNNNNNNNNNDKYLHYTSEDGYYKTSPYEPVVSLNTTLDKYVWRNLKNWQNNVAALDIVNGRQYTFAELRDCSAALAVRLQRKFKLVKGDVLAICLPNVPEYPGAILGAIEAGLTITTVNPLYTAEEISRQLIFSNAKFIIGTCRGFSILSDACKLAKKNIPIACVRMTADELLPERGIDFFEIFKPDDHLDYSQLQHYDSDPSDLVLLPFSSGTTGLPKGVMLSHNNIVTNAEQIQVIIPTDCTHNQEVIPTMLPFFHIYGLTVTMISRLSFGCKLVTMPQFKPEDLMKSLNDHKGSILNLVPPIALFMINSSKMSYKTAPNLRMVLSGAAPIAISDIERFIKKFPHTKFLQGYGMTETSPVVLLTPIGNKRYASTGFPTSNTEAKIVSFESGDLKGLGPNQTGELCVRGPQVMQGYLNNSQATDEAFYPGGWLRTGDVAHYDEDGYFYITDRMKELIKVKGFQVPPAELEAILRNHPKILDAAVFGVPHAINGEVPKALVVLRPEMKASEEEIFKYVANRVAHYKQLAGGIIFTNEVPKNPTGKILRRILKEQYST
uniref:Luciferin 4-monooxygenase n=1 Tax=Glossina morsitans morsitans TaxID=37546 RepID=R4IJP7_GLOMM|nr:acyl-CoA synthetase [Glossina morsitans morsitans]